MSPTDDLTLDRGRFVLRPELGLLYDRRYGLEHSLNPTAVAMTTTLVTGVSAAAVAALSHALAIPNAVALSELEQLRRRFLQAPDMQNPTRKSGAPTGWLDVDLAFPLALELELTKVCNWHCDFCYNVWKVSDDFGQRSRSEAGGPASNSHLRVETVEAILDEAVQGGCLRIRLSGGEPTLHPQFDEIVAAVGARGFDAEVFTNGVRLDSNRARHLVDNNTRVLLVSIHGSPATHNRLARNQQAYVQAMSAIENGVAAGLRVVAEALVCEDNVADLPDLARRLHDCGVEHMSLMPYVAASAADPRQGIDPSQVPLVIDACRTATGDEVAFRVPCAPKHCLSTEPTPIDDRVMWEFDDHCGAGILWASVSWDGHLRHCPHSGALAGRVSDGIGRIWQDRIVPTVRSVLEPTPVCGSCSQFAACRGGCHLGRVHYVDAPDGLNGPVPVAITPKLEVRHVA